MFFILGNITKISLCLPSMEEEAIQRQPGSVQPRNILAIYIYILIHFGSWRRAFQHNESRESGCMKWFGRSLLQLSLHIDVSAECTVLLSISFSPKKTFHIKFNKLWAAGQSHLPHLLSHSLFFTPVLTSLPARRWQHTRQNCHCKRKSCFHHRVFCSCCSYI